MGTRVDLRPVGRTMVTALGAGPRALHTVLCPCTPVGEGMNAGYVAECGTFCMEATEQFMAGLHWCLTCRHD